MNNLKEEGYKWVCWAGGGLAVFENLNTGRYEYFTHNKYSPSWCLKYGTTRWEFLRGLDLQESLILEPYVHAVESRVLDTDYYTYYSNSQDYLALTESVGLPRWNRKNITGAIAVIGDGDIEAVWFTESARPYSVTAIYYALPYYRPKSWGKGKLPCYWLESNAEYWLKHWVAK